MKINLILKYYTKTPSRPDHFIVQTVYFRFIPYLHISLYWYIIDIDHLYGAQLYTEVGYVCFAPAHARSYMLYDLIQYEI